MDNLVALVVVLCAVAVLMPPGLQSSSSWDVGAQAPPGQRGSATVPRTGWGPAQRGPRHRDLLASYQPQPVLFPQLEHV